MLILNIAETRFTRQIQVVADKGALTLLIAGARNVGEFSRDKVAHDFSRVIAVSVHGFNPYRQQRDGCSFVFTRHTLRMGRG